MSSTDLSHVLEAGAVLTGAVTTEPAKDLATVLRNRLTRYHELIDSEKSENFASDDLDGLQLETAVQALVVIERAQIILADDIEKEREQERSKPKGPVKENPEDAKSHAMGARDMAQLRTLLSVVFKWALDPLLARINHGLPNRAFHAQAGVSQIIDVTSFPQDFELLVNLISRLYALLYPNGAKGAISQTFISAHLLNRHATDMLRPSLTAAWLPEPLKADLPAVPSNLRDLTLRLLSSLPASQTITSLGSILSSKPPPPVYVRKRCSALLSRQLLRPHGVNGLFAAVFGEDEGSEFDKDAPLERLEHVARVLRTVPAGMSAEDYYSQIIPRIFVFLSLSTSKGAPQAYQRAAAFTLSRMLSQEEPSFPHQKIASSILLSALHDPLLRIAPPIHLESSEDIPAPAPSSSSPLELSPLYAVAVITTVLTNTDPSPTLIEQLLGPIIPSLYSLLEYLQKIRTSDPATRESIAGLLKTWIRVSSLRDALEILWRVVEGERCTWEVDMAGQLHVVEKPKEESVFSLADLARSEEDDDMDVDTNPLNLYPDPIHFVRFLRSIDRENLSSEIFVRLLESYQELKNEGDDGDPMQTLLRLQLIMQMQNQLTDTASSTNMLRRPTQILSFIKHALEPSKVSQSDRSQRTGRKGLGVKDLRIVPEDEEEEEAFDGEDSDDEDALGLEGVQRSEEMSVTAVNLLLSILGANPDLSARTTPILNEIFELLEPIARDASDILRPLAREARLVMTARLASTSSSFSQARKGGGAQDEEDAQATYQRALKLLQDPILPVRAHGLVLLRELVSPRRLTKKSSIKDTKNPTPHVPPIDTALVPAILSIFFESVQDDDSYIFLNAVQGLSAMVDGFGREVLRGLIDVYTSGIGGIGDVMLTKKEVDVRIRVGEALGQVIRRCGEALPNYVDMIVPRLSKIIRSSHLPTTIRTSSISLLGQCADTSSLALLPYSIDLTDTMIDLLQIESVAATNQAASSHSSRDNKTKTTSAESTSHDHADPLSAGKKVNDPQGANAKPKPTQRSKLKIPVPSMEEETESSTPEKNPDDVPPTMDSDPISSNTIFPPLRRASLYFLSLLIRSTTTYIYENTTSTSTYQFPETLVRRAKIVLNYVAATDIDDVVRIMARETVEALVELQSALLGF